MPVENISASDSGGAPTSAGSFVDSLNLGDRQYNLRPSHPFVYLAHPARWDVYDSAFGTEPLPDLLKFIFQPGISGVRYVEGQIDGDPTVAIAEKQRKGWILVPPSMDGLTAFGAAVPGYAQRYATTAKSTDGRALYAYYSAWERPYQVGQETFFERDLEGYYHFLRIVKASLIPAIDENVLRRVSARIKDHLSSLLRAGLRAGAPHQDIDLLKEKSKALEQTKKKAAK